MEMMNDQMAMMQQYRQIKELRERIAKMQEAIDDAYVWALDGQASTAAKYLHEFASEKAKAEVE